MGKRRRETDTLGGDDEDTMNGQDDAMLLSNLPDSLVALGLANLGLLVAEICELLLGDSLHCNVNKEDDRPNKDTRVSFSK